MKEHAFFIQSSIPPIHRELIQRANTFRQQFGNLLAVCIRLANGSVSREALDSGENYTRYTYEAERIAQKFTGVPINRELTEAETNIEPLTPYANQSVKKEQSVSELNSNILNLLNSFLKFKAELLDSQISCRLYTFIYTGVLDHILREGKEYLDVLKSLQKKEKPMVNQEPDLEMFWNRIMLDHTKTMRGLLDPSEADLLNEANDFSIVFEKLTENAYNQTAIENLDSLNSYDFHEALDSHNGLDSDDSDDDYSDLFGIELESEVEYETENIYEESNKTLRATRGLASFKADTTRGLIECKIKAIMLPLFTDHLLREANHYIRLLLDQNR